MSEIKTFRLVDRIAHPLTKVCITQFAFARGIFFCDKFFQVVKIELFAILTEIPKYVLNSNIAVVICVKT